MSKPGVVEQAARFIAREGLIPPGARIVAAHSGGADSTALLHILYRLRDRFGFALETLHVHHGLRGAAADTDAAFCAETARALGLPHRCVRIDPARIPPGNREEYFRDARQGAYRQAAPAETDRVALGHTREDQAETFLLRLLRGAGSQGLGAMAPRRARLIRPLLDLPRQALRDYLSGAGIPWREDETNRDRTFTRNRIRHEIWPAVEGGFPHAARRIAETCRLLREESAALRQLAEERALALMSGAGGGNSFRTEELAALPPGIRTAVTREIVRLARGNLRRLQRAHFLSIAAFARPGRSRGALHLPGLALHRDGDRVRFGPPPPETEPFAYVLPCPGQVFIPATGETFSCAWDPGQAPDAVPLPLAEGESHLLVRSFRPGDAIALPCGTKKVKKLFQEARLPLPERARTALVCNSAGDVLWIPRLKRSLCYNIPGIRTIFAARQS